MTASWHNRGTDKPSRVLTVGLLWTEDDHCVVYSGGEVDKANVSDRIQGSFGSLDRTSESVGLGWLDNWLWGDRLDTWGWEVQLAILPDSVGWSGNGGRSVWLDLHLKSFRLNSIEVDLARNFVGGACEASVFATVHRIEVGLNLILNLMMRTASYGPGGHPSKLVSTTRLDIELVAAVQALLQLILGCCQLRVETPRAEYGSWGDVGGVSHHVGYGADQMGIVTVHIGSVFFHSVEGRSGPMHLQTGGRSNQTSGSNRGVVLPDAGSRVDAVVLPAACGLDLGIRVVDVSPNVLGHVLRGCSLSNEGVNDGSEGADGVLRVLTRLNVVSCGGVARGGLHHLCR